MIRKVLIVDDAHNLRFSMEVILKMNGFETFGAANGKEALDRIVESQKSGEYFDLVITDIVMPKMSGIELMENLDELGIKMKIIVITGFLNDDYRERLKALGRFSVLEKPFEMEKLVGKVRESLSAA